MCGEDQCALEYNQQSKTFDTVIISGPDTPQSQARTFSWVGQQYQQSAGQVTSVATGVQNSYDFNAVGGVVHGVQALQKLQAGYGTSSQEWLEALNELVSSGELSRDQTIQAQVLISLIKATSSQLANFNPRGTLNSSGGISPGKLAGLVSASGTLSVFGSLVNRSIVTIQVSTG